jgi:pimeloyl-ACP methyl ester carboxylesterase
MPQAMTMTPMFSMVLFAFSACLGVVQATDPDVHATIDQLVTEAGFLISNTTVDTADHCTLRIFKVTAATPPPKTKRKPVLLVHGVLDSADTWVLNGAHQSLALMLAAQGYAVYLSNSRGNKYGASLLFLKACFDVDHHHSRTHSI